SPPSLHDALPIWGGDGAADEGLVDPEELLLDGFQLFSPRVSWSSLRPPQTSGPMGLVLHGSARTTQAIRRSIQCSQKTVSALAKQHGINRKTVAKWRRRQTVQDAPMGPKRPCSTVLTPEEEAAIVAFRRHTLLALDDCLYALQPTI